LLQHPSPEEWLWSVAALLVLIALHTVVAWWLCKARDGEESNTIKPRTVGVLVLAFVNPLQPFTSLIFLLLAYRSFANGTDPNPNTIEASALPKGSK
jgi:hypothetical protein